MDRKRIYITRKIPDSAVELLKKHFYVEMNEEDRPLNREEFLQNIEGKDAVICQLTDKIDAEAIERGKSVKIFANYAVGFNNVDVDEASNRGVVITNTPGVLTHTTADLAWALLFAAARRIVEADRYTREGKFKGWSPSLFLGQDITGKTLGIIGMGRIGRAFAKKSIGFDMKIIYYNRSRDLDFEKYVGATWVEKEELFKQADFLAVHLPLTEKTYHLVGEKEFSLMKRTAVFINTSRGPIVDERALVKALREGWIWAAGLDVFEREPEIEEELLTMDNVVLAPHIGSASLETRVQMGIMAAMNIIAVLNGQKPLNPVNNI